MKEWAIDFIVWAIIIAITVCICIDAKEQEQIKEEGNIQCEHEFVTTSRYNWLLNAYKTYSKCTKCGKEI